MLKLTPQRFTSIFLLLAAALFAGSASARIEMGRDYDELITPQPTTSKGKIEVLEFFSYACSHCAKMDPALEPWVKKLPKDVAFSRSPVTFNEQITPLVKAYFALEGMKLVEKFTPRLFTAIHQTQELNDIGERGIAEWMGTQGVDEKKFAAAMSSFTVAGKTKHAMQMQQSYNINGIPTFVVDGKYATGPELTGSEQNTLRVLNELIAKARQERASKKGAAGK
jgi:protein dithiol oxidoreductase (disulfide-forming)